MSRIIVKQLPKNISEEKLKSIFGAKGTITDLQLKYTPDGKFRQFCFIGYYTEEEAENAIKFFNNTCIQTSRIKVEKCASLGSEEKPQSWSKYAKDSKINATEKKVPADEVDVNKKKTKASKLDEILGKHKDDPDFQEFLQVHDRTRTLWGNDVTVIENLKDTNSAAKEHKGTSNENEDDANQDSGVSENNGNDSDIQEEDKDDESADNKEEKHKKLAEKSISDLDYMKSLISGNSDQIPTNNTKASTASKSKGTGDNNSIDLYTIKIQNIPYKTKRQDILTFFKPLKPYSVRLPRQVCGFCYVGFKSEKDMIKAMLKNKSFIKGKQVFFSDFTEKNKITKSKKAIGESCTDNQSNGEIHDNPKWHKQKDNLRNEENISESGSIFFRNLPYTVTEEDLQKVFSQFGPVAEIHMPVDTITRQIKGFGTVTFVMPEHAVVAFNKLDGTDFHGRLLHLIPGKSRDNNDELDLNENGANLTFKQKKDLKLKKTAQQASTWNTLFLGQNAVAEILSQKYGMSKEQILDTNEGGSSAAVRIALGETQIVIEMRKFLEEQGVHLNAFESTNAKRSKTIILAKNLPAATQIEDLTAIFAKFGPIGRLVLPPSGVTALIEFCDPSEARQAFKKLAYSKFKNVPLFLEWAPENTFTTTLSGNPIAPKIKEEEKAAVKSSSEKESAKQDETEAKENIKEEEEQDDTEPEPNTTLFLRNLNFKTVLETVREHFKHLGAIHTIEIAKRKDQTNPTNWNSLGYGFIQFKKSETAARALKEMQLTHIDGNQVELKRSDRILKSSLNTPQRKTVNLTKQTGTKMLVRNIPFQAKAKEVREIFAAFGQLRTVRLPLKMTPGEQSHRGFGFVDYMAKSDAKTAFEALSQSTHLYGRRLVLEWASTEDEDVNALRKRTASHFNATNAATADKRSKKSVFNSEDIESNNTITHDA